MKEDSAKDLKGRWVGVLEKKKVKQIDTPKTLVQGQSVMRAHITRVCAASAISVVSIPASLVLPLSGQRYLTFQGFCKLFSLQLELVFLTFPFSLRFYFEMNRDV